jgi:signal transduction histidine kinase
MNFKNFLDSINIAKQCRKYNLSIWQCPQFLFLILGLVVVISSLAIYFIGIHYSDDPEIIALIVLLVSVFLIMVDFSIIKSFEKLAEVAKMKSEFVSIVSHQLRSPLSNLKWIVDLLISGKIEPVSEKQSAYLQILRENSQRMEGLVSDLLIVSRLEADNLPFKNTKASLAELVKSLILRTESFISASNVEIKLTVEENLPDIFFDYQRIEQAIGNILDNATRYIGFVDASGKPGHIKEKGDVEVILKREDNRLCLEIKDNGIGIPKDDQKHIFQKFFRASNANKVQAQGSGLGLYIAKSIIEKSGGKIYFVSRENEGSTFSFNLPIK